MTVFGELARTARQRIASYIPESSRVLLVDQIEMELTACQHDSLVFAGVASPLEWEGNSVSGPYRRQRATVNVEHGSL